MNNQELKSKVMALGNRLASRMERHVAFVRAWAIVKAGSMELAVKGVSFGNRQEALKRLAAYAPDQIRTVLVPEPTNAKDTNAVAVMVGVQNGKGLFRLGYVPRDMAPVVSALNVKLPALRVVCGVWGWSGKYTLGARVALSV